MKQKEKDLLIKDLCSRLPYGVMVHEKWKYQNPGVKERTEKEEDHIMNCYDLASIETIKPYLRPMSNMTEEEYNSIVWAGSTHSIRFSENEFHFLAIKSLTLEALDLLNAHHFDYRGLIEKGLALEAPEGMYKQISKE